MKSSGREVVVVKSENCELQVVTHSQLTLRLLCYLSPAKPDGASAVLLPRGPGSISIQVLGANTIESRPGEVADIGFGPDFELTNDLNSRVLPVGEYSACIVRRKRIPVVAQPTDDALFGIQNGL